MYKAIDIANYIINKSIDNKCPISNLKLQKLLYYVQAAKLVQTGGKETLFCENICAWKYGPVVNNVYHRFKIYIDSVITEKNMKGDLEFIDGAIRIPEHDPYDIIDGEDQELIDYVVLSYKDYSPIEMVKKTHNEDPWKDANRDGEKVISIQSIYKYYNDNKTLILGAA